VLVVISLKSTLPVGDPVKPAATDEKTIKGWIEKEKSWR
jgi:hypothetical protein